MNMSAVGAKELLAALAHTTAATAAGSAIDLQGWVNPGGRQMKAILSAHAVSGTSPTLDITIQESDTTATSGFTDITGAAFAQVTTADSFQEIHFRTTKRYVRGVRVTTGTTPTFHSAVILLGEDRQV